MSLEQDVQILTKIPLLAGLEAEALRLLAFSAEKLTLAKDEILFRRDETSDCGYVLMAGALLISVEDSNLTVSAPALVGELALIVATNRTSDATALQPSLVMKVPRHLFLRVLREFPAGAGRLRNFLSQSLLEFTLSLDDARNRADARVP